MSMSVVNSAVATLIILWGTAHAVTTRAHTRQVTRTPHPHPRPHPHPHPHPRPHPDPDANLSADPSGSPDPISVRPDLWPGLRGAHARAAL